MEIYVSLAFLSALSLLILGLQLYRVDRRREFIWFLPLMGAAAVWAFFSGLWLVLPAGFSMFMNKLSFLGIITLPVFLFLFGMDFSNRRRVFRRGNLVVIWVIPAISILLMLTNELHGLFWSEVYPGLMFGDVVVSHYVPGPWYFVHSAYSYGLIFVALGLLFIELRKRRAVLWQYGLVLGIVVPLMTSIFYFFGLTQIDYSPLTLSLTVLAFGWFMSTGFYERNILKLQSLQKQTDEMNRLYDLIVQISERLIQTHIDEMEEAVNDVIAELGDFTGVDRVYVFEYDRRKGVVNNTFEWCRRGISREIDNLQGIPVSAVPRWMDRFNDSRHVYIPSVKDLPDDPIHQKEKEILLEQEVKSLVVVPMYHADELAGFVGFDSVRKYKMWDDKTVALLGVMADIISGNLMRAEYERALIREKQNAEAANRAKTEFLANMSHELRTPMNSILGFTDVVMRNMDDSPERVHLQMVLKSGHSLMRLLNDLLDFSKAEAGVLELHPTETNVMELLEFVKDTFMPKAEEKGLDLQVRFDGSSERLFLLDEGRLRQVLFNMVGNAIKFTREGMVEVVAGVEGFEGGDSFNHSAGKPSDLPFEGKQPAATSNGDGADVPDGGAAPSCQLVFKIIDTGIGIAESDQQSIFAAFSQVSRGSNRAYQGTGLGLNISQRLVHLMGGTIGLESTPGKGSVFTVKIPCE